MEKIDFLKQKQGSTLIVALCTLLVLSLVGIMALHTATIETQISGNLRSYKNNFYKTESAVREMALALQNTPDSSLVNSNRLTLPNNNTIILSNSGNLVDNESVLSYRLLIANNPSSANFQNEPIYNNSKVLVVDGGPAPGTSISIGFSHAASAKHKFFIFGNTSNGATVGHGVLIEIGYLRRIRY